MNLSTPTSGEISTVGTFTEIYEKLLPVLLQCFVIVAFGYASGVTRIVPQSDMKGLQLVVSYFFLPALIFRSLATIDFNTVNYKFLAAILIGKLIIFLSAAVLTWLLKRQQRSSFAGLFGIFCSQSNDFALGYPLVKYLYGQSQPEFAHYLYLIAPIQLMIINPFGFVLMEYGRIADGVNRPARCRSSVASRCKATLIGIVRNPISVMTAAGILANLAFKRQLPQLVEVIMEPLGAAFSASALFLLGQNMVGGFSSMSKYTVLTTALIVLAKVLAAPIVIREVISHLDVGQSAYTDFGFLYGMLPPAPTVAIFASQFCLAGEAVSTGVVVGTFVSAPLIFITATMSRISESSESYHQIMTTAICYTSAIALPFCLWTLFVLLPKSKRVTHSTAMWLLVAQTVTCVGGLMLFWVIDDGSVMFYVHTCVSLSGIFASRIWTVLIAVTLMLCHERSLCFVLKIRSTMLVGGFAASLIASLILMAGIPFGSRQNLATDPNFHLGKIQAGVALVFLLMSFVVTIFALVRQQRIRSRDDYEPLFVGEHDTSPALVPAIVPARVPAVVPARVPARVPAMLPAASSALVDADGTSAVTGGCARCSCHIGSEPNASGELPDVEDFGKPVTFVKRKVPRVRRLSERKELTQAGGGAQPFVYPDPATCGPSFSCSPAERKLCISSVKQYLDEVVQPADEITEPDVDLHQNFRHVCLLLMLLFSMMIGTAVCLWQLFTEKPSGILLELEFLDIVLNYGQGVLTFVVFGLDASGLQLTSRAIRDVFSRGQISVPPFCELSAEAKQQCEQFRIYHLEIFANDVWPQVNVESIRFSGQQMCDWLCLVGLSKSRDDAITYGRSLLDGRIISHISNVKHFEDNDNLYQFLNVAPCAALANPNRSDFNI